MFRKLIGLLAYAVPYWRSILGLFLATLIAAAMTALQPWPLKFLVDILGSDAGESPQIPLFGGFSSQPLLGIVCLAGILLFAVQSALDALLSWGWTLVGRRMVYSLAADLFGRLQRRSLLFHSRTAVGETITRVNGDCWALYRVFDALLAKPVYAFLSIALMLFLMSRVDGFLTVIVALIALTAVAASFFAGRGLRQVGEILRSLEAELRSHVQQTLAGISVVQTYGRESFQQNRFEQISLNLVRAHQRNAVLGALNGLASGFALSVGTVLIIGISAYAAIEGTITIGSVLLFAGYLVALQIQLKHVVTLYPTIQSLMASVARVDEVLVSQPEIADRPSASPLRKVVGNIQFENVCFEYEAKPILKNVSFDAAAGQMTALVGPTGAGKSTLVSLIPRFFDPVSGRVLLDGRDLRDLRVASLREQIAIVLQEPFLFSGSIAENIAFGRPHATAVEIEDAARAARAHDFIIGLPHGYKTPLGDRGVNLSGGERQRISLARAFLKNAPIVILDEPTSAVDAETEALILKAVQTLSRGRTTFIIAHRFTTIQSADQVVVLDHGAVIEHGAPAQLAKAGNMYSRLHALNFDLAPLPT